jgi:AP-2 complex subunit beta-1
MNSIMFLPTIAYTAHLYAPHSVYRGLLLNHNIKGKVAELRAELSAPTGKKDKSHLGKKIALKKIVANMTMSNNDMVALFPDIVEVMGVQSLEIKKM